MGPAGVHLRKDQFIAALASLNVKLHAEGLQLTFYCIGGGALMLAYGARATTEDLDGSLSPTDPATVRRFEVLKAQVAAERSLPEQWINLQAASIVREQGFRQSDFVPKAGYMWSNLQLMFAKPECLLAMKLQAMRPRSSDLKDVEFLLRQLNIRSMSQVQDAIAKYFQLSDLGNDEVVPVKLAIATAFPGETEYEMLRLKALALYAEAKKR